MASRILPKRVELFANEISDANEKKDQQAEPENHVLELTDQIADLPEV